jgi:hypothetical protein
MRAVILVRQRSAIRYECETQGTPFRGGMLQLKVMESRDK